MECTKLNCPMQVGTVTENCGDSCPWRTTVKLNDLISRAAALEAIIGCLNIMEATGIDMTVARTIVKVVLNGAPAVDAVPVEWLEWRVMNAKYNGIKEAADAFDFVLKCWKEQEAR